MSKMKRIKECIGNTCGGDNKAGEVIHGFLDLLPIPNQPIGKLIKALLMGTKEDAFIELKKLLTIRNIIASGIAVLIITDIISLEQFLGWVETFIKVFTVLG